MSFPANQRGPAGNVRFHQTVFPNVDETAVDAVLSQPFHRLAAGIAVLQSV